MADEMELALRQIGLAARHVQNASKRVSDATYYAMHNARGFSSYAEVAENKLDIALREIGHLEAILRESGSGPAQEQPQ